MGKTTKSKAGDTELNPTYSPDDKSLHAAMASPDPWPLDPILKQREAAPKGEAEGFSFYNTFSESWNSTGTFAADTINATRTATAPPRIAMMEHNGHIKWDGGRSRIDEHGHLTIDGSEPALNLYDTANKLANTPQAKLTGGDVNYYLVDVPNPKRLTPYTMEVEDIIEALDMTFAEATVFKSLIRSANKRKGLGKPGNTAKYDAEKMIYYSRRVLAKVERDAALQTEINLPASDTSYDLGPSRSKRPRDAYIKREE